MSENSTPRPKTKIFPAGGLCIGLIVGFYLLMSGICAFNLEKIRYQAVHQSPKEKKPVELDGIIFGSLLDAIAYKKEQEVKELAPWILMINEGAIFPLLVIGFGGGMVGGSSRKIIQWIKNNDYSLWFFWILLGGVCGILSCIIFAKLTLEKIIDVNMIFLLILSILGGLAPEEAVERFQNKAKQVAE